MKNKSEAQRRGEAIHAEVERHLKERGDGRNVYRERALYKQAAEKFAAAIDRASQLAPKILKDDLLRAFVEGGVEATCRAVESEKGKGK